MTDEVAAAAELLRSMVGADNYRDIESIIEGLSSLAIRGAIGGEWHAHIIEQLAGELVAQQIANDVATEALTDAGGYPDAPATEVR